METVFGRARILSRIAHGRSRTALSGFVLVAGMFSYGFRLARVRGASMEPTYYNGQWLLVRRMDWPAPPLHPGEVIVFRLGRDLLVKRVAATAGQPMPDAEPLVARLRTSGHTGAPRLVLTLAGPPVVPTGYVYVLGDNRPISDDSRSFGPVPLSSVVGRVLRWNDPGRVLKGDTEDP